MARYVISGPIPDSIFGDCQDIRRWIMAPEEAIREMNEGAIIALDQNAVKILIAKFGDALKIETEQVSAITLRKEDSLIVMNVSGQEFSEKDVQVSFRQYYIPKVQTYSSPLKWA